MAIFSHVQVPINDSVKQCIINYAKNNHFTRNSLIKEYLWHYIFNQDNYIDKFNQLKCNFNINNETQLSSFTFYMNSYFKLHLSVINKDLQRTTRSQFIYFLKSLYTFIKCECLPNFSAEAPYNIPLMNLNLLRENDFTSEILNLISVLNTGDNTMTMNSFKQNIFLFQDSQNNIKYIKTKLKVISKVSDINFNISNTDDFIHFDLVYKSVNY